MGGGDLNSKKSWHPNTMKNQERVWKAEQAAAEEKKRISELQRERAEERERAELNEMAKRSASSSSNNRLNWMYDKPDKKAQGEDYLLGKSIEKNYGNVEKDDESAIPAVSRRVVGSSMLASTGDAQVDLARKIREDPLLLVKERERAARAALLNNPLHRKRLADLLRKEQEQRKEKPKKKSKNKTKNLDNMLAEKLSALSGGKGLDIATLLACDDSSSDSDSSSESFHDKSKKKKHKELKRKKKAKKSKSKKKSNQCSDNTDESENEKDKEYELMSTDKYHHGTKSEPRKSRRDDDSFDYNLKIQNKILDRKRRCHQNSSDESSERKLTKRRDKNDKYDSGKRIHLPYSNYEKYKEKNIEQNVSTDIRKKEKRLKDLSAEEKAARLAAMATAGAEREVQRGRRVAEQRRADAAADTTHHVIRSAGNEARALPESLESRIHSNRHYIQRDRVHMNQHFARR